MVANLAKDAARRGRPSETLGRAWPHHWSDDAGIVLESHPEYDELAPLILEYKAKGRKLIASRRFSDPWMLLAEIIKKPVSAPSLKEFFDIWEKEQEAMIASYEARRATDDRNRAEGSLRSVRNVFRQFEKSFDDIRIDAIDYNIIMAFRKNQLLAGNSGNTVHSYLGTLRGLYNKALRYYKLPDGKPFEKTMDGLLSKSFASGKKYLEKETVTIIEQMNLKGEQARARDLWLLQFYFGGADLIDIYFLKKVQLKRGRVYFTRGKIRASDIIDLKVHPKAAAIIERYRADDGEWLFPWRKDVKGYETFRTNVADTLIEVQKQQNASASLAKNDALRIDVQPLGGNLAIKVARHTFANIAKGMMIDTDVVREIQGHRRNDVDNYYKDKHKEAVRDAALWKIIE